MSDDEREGRRVVGSRREYVESADYRIAELEAKPGEVRFELTWNGTQPDRLSGELIATNVSTRTWRLSGKPIITPLDLTGAPLRTQHVITTEGRIPNYVEVQPGHRARAIVNWGWWDGAETSAQVRVTWEGGASDITVTGPTHPERTKRSHRMTTSSDWWRLAG